MEFLTKLEPTKETVKFNEIAKTQPQMVTDFFGLSDNKFQMFKGITFDNIHLSIQGSYSHYCSPRITTDKENYSSMELAVIIDGEWVSIDDDHFFDDFDRHDEFKERNDTKGLYAYLDVENIERLYQYIKAKKGA